MYVGNIYEKLQYTCHHIVDLWIRVNCIIPGRAWTFNAVCDKACDSGSVPVIVVDTCILFGNIMEVDCNCLIFVKIVASDFVIKSFDAPLLAFIITSELLFLGRLQVKYY